MQGVSLMKAHTNKRVMEAVQEERIPKLEASNAKLLVKVEQARLALAKAEVARDTLYVNHGKLDVAQDALYVAACEGVHKNFQYYHVRHRKKLHELWVNMEKAMNEIGV
jgi:hypothetical protein